jgi:predicted membrane-bound spermidine synthase
MVRNPIKMFIARTGRYPEKALVIGGGDGLAAREFYRCLPDVDLTQVELDDTLLKFSSKHPVMKRLNNNALNHPYLKLLAGDGIDFLINTPETYDIIIDDCDIEVTNQPKEFKTRYGKYQDSMIKKLNPGGIACIMEPLVSTAPGSYKHTPKDYKARQKWIKKRITDLDALDISLPHRYAVADLPHIGPELYIYIPKPSGIIQK